MKLFKISILLALVTIKVNLLQAQQNSIASDSSRTTYITGKINDGMKHDTLTLVVSGPFYYGAVDHEATQILTATANVKGEFKFKIVTGNSPFHLSLFLSKRNKNGNLPRNVDIDDYLIEPGDSIHVTFDQHSHHFSGVDSYLFKAQYAIEQIDSDRCSLTQDTLGYFDTDTKKWLQQKDSLLNLQLQVLSDYKSMVSPGAYEIVRADIIGTNRAWLYRIINFSGPFLSAELPLTRNVADLCRELERRPPYIEQENRAALSPKYVYYLYEKLRIEVKYDRIINHVNIHINENYFSAINKEYSGILRDKLLAWWLIRITAFNDMQPKYPTEALSVMQSPFFIKIVDSLQKNLSKGGVLTDFGFKDVNGRTVHLADFKGKVILIDVWFTGCHGCVMVAAGLPYVERAFKNRSDLAFVSISIDKDKELWLGSIGKNPRGLLYTPNYATANTTYLYTAGTGRYNPFVIKYLPDGSCPSLMIVDKEGKIFSATPSRPTTVLGKKNLINEIQQALSDQ